MGEEPERLRALTDAQIVREWLTDGGSYDARAARVWRVAPLRVQSAFDALLAEVERLAGERDALEARLETRIEDDAVYRVYDEKATECEEWRRAAFNDRQKVITAEAECERLAGRVAALVADCRPVIAHGLSGGSPEDALRYVDRKLADVGGSG